MLLLRMNIDLNLRQQFIYLVEKAGDALRCSLKDATLVEVAQTLEDNNINDSPSFRYLFSPIIDKLNKGRKWELKLTASGSWLNFFLPELSIELRSWNNNVFRKTNKQKQQ